MCANELEPAEENQCPFGAKCDPNVADTRDVFSFRRQQSRKPGRSSADNTHATEAEHWNEVEGKLQRGERIFWRSHPRIDGHYRSRALLDGLSWRDWVPKTLGRPAAVGLELGCGSGAELCLTRDAGTARQMVGLDLDESRFASISGQFHPVGADIRLLAADINTVELEPNSYELIYSLMSFHHFESLERIMDQVSAALTSDGFFILDEYVGPARFQWTEAQMAITNQVLGIMPRQFRLYQNGTEKREEGRPAVADVIRLCPSESIRSNEIVPLFHRFFDVVHEKRLGGTIQHLLYNGIVQNLPDNDEFTDHMIDSIDALEQTLISSGYLTSDFVLLVGRKRGSRGSI